MRVACLALHFGKEYLAWAVRGVQASVDEIHIHYAPKPSYGYTQHLPCPDSEEELRAQADRFAEKPIRWFTVEGTSRENDHRMIMDRTAREAGAGMYVVIDADEVWDPCSLRATMDAVWAANRGGRWLARFANFWRSFRYQVDDGFMPVRIIDCRFPLDGGDAYLDEIMQPQPVYHFGYAQSLATMRYKLSVHSHTDELRPGWLEGTFIPWRPGDTDCHPTAFNLWTPRPTSPEVLVKVNELLSDHPYAGAELVA
jgi:hypothetical protein